jgi:hypothetical protein
MKDYDSVIAFITFTIGICVGSFLHSHWQLPVIQEQAVIIIAQDSRIYKLQEDLLWSTNELVFLQDGMSKLREQQEDDNILIMKVEDFYKIDLRRAKKGAPGKLDQLVAERIKDYRGMGGE